MVEVNNRLFQLGRHASRQTLFSQYIGRIRIEVFCLHDLDLRLFFRGQGGFEVRDDGSGDVALHLENVRSRQIPVKALGPQRLIGTGVNELDVDAHLVAGSQDIAIHYCRDTKFATNLISRLVCLTITLNRSARNNLDVMNLGQRGQQIAVDSLGEKRGTVLGGTNFGKRQNGNRLGRNLLLGHICGGRRQIAFKDLLDEPVAHCTDDDQQSRQKDIVLAIQVQVLRFIGPRRPGADYALWGDVIEPAE